MTVSQRAPTTSAQPGTEPTANGSYLMATGIAIRQPRAAGAHHVDPAAGRWCLR
ncbi:hypothetical protein [Streptomyces sp. NPDC093094]|uniref:hypothetical protein n=1 Tax=Streptomyces sp. NPDC093094 TaxID=3366026 RepID=UPI00380546FC